MNTATTPASWGDRSEHKVRGCAPSPLTAISDPVPRRYGRVGGLTRGRTVDGLVLQVENREAGGVDHAPGGGRRGVPDRTTEERAGGVRPGGTGRPDQGPGGPVRRGRNGPRLPRLLVSGRADRGRRLRQVFRRGREGPIRPDQKPGEQRLVGKCDGGPPERTGRHRRGLLRLPRLGAELEIRRRLDQGVDGRVLEGRRRSGEPLQPEQAAPRPICDRGEPRHDQCQEPGRRGLRLG